MTKRQLKDSLTQSTHKPGDFPLGSIQSRAAARAMIEAGTDDGMLRSIQIIYVDSDGTRTEGPRIEIPPV
jgi:hypothetical protein